MSVVEAVLVGLALLDAALLAHVAWALRRGARQRDDLPAHDHPRVLHHLEKILTEERETHKNHDARMRMTVAQQRALREMSAPTVPPAPQLPPRSGG